VKPPAGALFETQPDGFVAAATLRSAQAWFRIPFTLVWSGGSLGGIYGSQFHTGTFDLVNSLFGLFFVAGTLLLVPQAIMSALGRVVIKCRGEEGSVFCGVGQLGRTWRFRWEDVVSIQQALRKGHRGSVTRFIRVVFRTPTRAPLEFGDLLSDERKGFVISVMRWQLARRAR
jgi:hypothetical protein